jgi:putative transposase
MSKPANPFRYFNSSPEVIRLVVMMYVKFPLSLRNVEDLLAERGIDVSYETVRYWWNRFGPMFAAEIRRKRVEHMRAFTHWRWHLDEVYVKINGEMRYLWRAVDHEGEVLESFATKDRDKVAALKFMKKLMKRHGTAKAITTDGLRSYKGCDVRARQRRQTRDRPLGQQPGGEQPPAIPTTRKGDEPLPQDEDPAEVLIGSRLGPQPLQSGPPPHQPSRLPGETLRRAGGVAVSRGVSAAWVWAPCVTPETSCR